MIQSYIRERTDFSDEEGKILLATAYACIRAALENQPAPGFTGPLAQAPVAGVFVSLKRGGGSLRACCGSLNEKEPAPLGELLTAAAGRSALSDVRFPRIALEELPFLDLEVSVMHGIKTMPTDPNQRLKWLTIGRHGLILTFNKARGLLLPQVASENNWDKPTFFEHLCRKANVPADSWLKPDSDIKQFSAAIFHRAAEKPDPDFRSLKDPVIRAARELTDQVIREGRKGNLVLPESLKVPVSPLGWALLIQTSGKRTEIAFRQNGSLGELVADCAEKLHRPGAGEPEQVIQFLGLSHSIPLHPGDYPQRLGNIPPGQAVAARLGGRTSVVIRRGPMDPVQQVLQQMGQTPVSWQKNGLSLSLHQVFDLTKPPTLQHSITPSLQQSLGAVRPAAVAGKFYPATAEEIRQQLDIYFHSANEEAKIKVRAVMLPHAGWIYCGDIIAETLGQIHIPDIVVIVGPKHTPLGPRWSISNARKWQIPGAEVPLEEESVAFLAAHSKHLEKEPLAHQKEHGAEVLVPFFHYLNPRVKIVPIALGSGTHDEFAEFGSALRDFRKRLEFDGDDCLFVISSDLNHFADDKTNRRLDKMALDAFITGDTRRLFDTCNEHRISMCGMRPAVAVLSSLDLDIERQRPDIVITRYETSARITKDPSRVVGYAGALIS